MAISRFTTTQRSLNQSLDRSFNLTTMKTNPTTIVYNPFKIRIDKSRFPFYQIPSLYLSILSLLFPSSTHSYPYSILLLFSTKARARKPQRVHNWVDRGLVMEVEVWAHLVVVPS